MISPDKKRLEYLSWLTLLGMSAMGILLMHYALGRELKSVFLGQEPYYKNVGHKPLYLQIAAGVFFGSFSALLGVALVKGKRFRNVRTFFESLIGEINPSLTQILFYSFCASVGEEILFRAGVQPIIGIWPASIVFVLLHGYLNPSNFSLMLYGIFLIVVCAGFGYMFRYFGLSSSIVAHFIYDVSMFCVLRYAHEQGKQAN